MKMIKFALKAKRFDSQTQNIFCYDKNFINILHEKGFKGFSIIHNR